MKVTEIIEKICAERVKYADFWQDHPQFLDLISEHIYPDKAHFIYELLQNAEDTGATTVRFDLYKDKLLFEHNGKPFDEDDVRAITDIAKSLKRKDKIGRFGIGFKAVYNYTKTPHIWSSPYCFLISGYYLPREIQPEAGLGKLTRFMFPFDRSDKEKSDIYNEIHDGLNDIYRNTLLFLGNIKSIVYLHNKKEVISISRIEHPLNRVEIKQITNGKIIKGSHYLLFKKKIENLRHLAKHHVALAYELQPPQSDITDSNETNGKYKITEASPGNVAIYLPAKKEASNLKFHLHAPFVPVAGRSEIKDTDENQSLINQLATLAAESLPVIKKSGLLDGNFLEVLPNSTDNVPEKYDCIRVAIIDAMRGQSLTPAHSGNHLPVKNLWRGSMNVRSLLSNEDIELLYENTSSKKVDWAVGVMRGRATNFLNDLGLEEWDSAQFTQILIDKVGGQKDKRKEMHDWLNTKPDKWLQNLYALLYEEVDDHVTWQKLKELKIVRIANGGYKKGNKCFFSALDEQEDEQYPRVAIETYRTSKEGNEDDAERKSRMFLEEIGVRELGKRELLEVLLKRRYSIETGLAIKWEEYMSDIFAFIKISNEDSASLELIRNYNIFLSNNKILMRPENIYLDSPYLETGLQSYYDLVNPNFEEIARFPLSKRFTKLSKEEKEKFIEFANNCGVVAHLVPRRTSCSNNPGSDRLHSTPGVFRAGYGVDQDFVVDQLDVLFNQPNLELSKLVWNNLEYWHDKYFEAKYQPNRSSEATYEYSQLLHLLIGSNWVPQTAKKTAQFVCPPEAKREQLPKDFIFPRHAPWLEQIRFGQGTTIDEEKQELAKLVGYSSFKEVEENLLVSKWIKSKDPKLYRKLYREIVGIDQDPKLGQKSKNPERRRKKVREDAQSAPNREVVSKKVNVSNIDSVKKERTRPYLRDMYTRHDEVMICQVCMDELPFNLPNGEYYFEMVELFTSFKKVHYQNYLALCPLHAAMYKHANDSRATQNGDKKDKILDIFKDLVSGEQILDLTLAGQPEKLYFAINHINDLKEVIDVEKQLLKSDKQ